MRTWLLVVIKLLFSIPAFACPDITGNYLCKEQDGREDTLVLVLGEKNGVATLYDQADEYFLDEKKHALEWEMLSGSYVASCKSQQILVEIAGEIFIDGVKFGDMTLTDTYMPKDEATIYWQSHYKRKHTDGSTYVSNELWVCSK